ncbi:MAG TPA: response regulator transcription factor [Candidatus Krumholzibacteria bacterium]|nr:response regulator transcription factor [Candidatus Krumholzibacteria bacterium]
MNAERSSPKLKILIVDDHTLVREALAAQLSRQEGFEVVDTLPSADNLFTRVSELKPDLILMDIDMPGMICFDAAHRLNSLDDPPRIIFVSAFFHDHYIEQALRVRARGYVVKSDEPSVLIEAIREVASGGSYFSEQVRARLMVDDDGVELAAKGKTVVSLLTQREIEVLRYIAQGLPKKEIARTMHLSVKTVENHSARLMAKLNIHDRVELARFAIREGLAEA